MAYDSARTSVVMFGGNNNSSYLNETWEYDGVDWAQVTTANSPAIRDGHAMAYHSGRGRVVMFGGDDGNNLFNDTWEYDGVDWTQIFPANSPGARYAHTMAYDSTRGSVVMFGGPDGGQYFNDTWEYGPAGSSAAMTYGVGCGDPPLTLTPEALAPPVIGSTAQVVLTNIPSSLAFMALGWSNVSVGGIPLPLPLGSYGMPGCELLQSAEAPADPVQFTGPDTATYSLPLPNWSSLIGVRLYLQGWAAAPGYNAANIIFSNGVEWVIEA